MTPVEIKTMASLQDALRQEGARLVERHPLTFRRKSRWWLTVPGQPDTYVHGNVPVNLKKSHRLEIAEKTYSKTGIADETYYWVTVGETRLGGPRVRSASEQLREQLTRQMEEQTKTAETHLANVLKAETEDDIATLIWAAQSVLVARLKVRRELAELKKTP